LFTYGHVEWGEEPLQQVRNAVIWVEGNDLATDCNPEVGRVETMEGKDNFYMKGIESVFST
jgi:hypothetical protein